MRLLRSFGYDYGNILPAIRNDIVHQRDPLFDANTLGFLRVRWFR